MRKVLFATGLVFALSTATWATTPAPAPPTTATTTYYYGTGIIPSSPTGARRVSLSWNTGFQPGTAVGMHVLLMRTVDPVKGTITEFTCTNGVNMSSAISTVTMQITNGQLSSVSDGTPQLTGTGTLVGTPWAWSAINFNLNYSTCSTSNCNTQIIGSEYMVQSQDPSGNPINMLVGRKQILASDGTPLELDEVEMGVQTLAFYNSMYSILACPAAPTPVTPTPATTPAK